MIFLMEFNDILKRIKRLRVPASKVNGRIIEPFYLDVIEVDDEVIKCEGKDIEYFLINERTDLTKILHSANERAMTTLLIHTQFLPRKASDEQLADIAEQGSYKYMREEWTGDMKECIVDVYSLAQAGKWAQFERYGE